jgi:hypothetical protein
MQMGAENIKRKEIFKDGTNCCEFFNSIYRICCHWDSLADNSRIDQVFTRSIVDFSFRPFKRPIRALAA